MDFECAVSWNQQHPVGTCVKIRRVDGTSFLAKTSGRAQQWGSFAIVALEGQLGMWTTRALIPAMFDEHAPPAEPTALLAEAADGA